MPKGYHHLPKDQRCQLDALKSSGKPIDDIAIQLGVDRCSAHRELRRNGGIRGYTYQEAQKKASERKRSIAHYKRKMTHSGLLPLRKSSYCSGDRNRFLAGLRYIIKVRLSTNMSGRTSNREVVYTRTSDTMERNTTNAGVEKLGVDPFQDESILLKDLQL